MEFIICENKIINVKGCEESNKTEKIIKKLKKIIFLKIVKFSEIIL
jgi:hypothetical protein